MSNAEIRALLEGVYGKYRTAILEEDFGAFEAVAVIGDDLAGRKAKKAFKKGKKRLAEEAHDLDQASFLALGEMPGGVLAYVYLWEEPGFANMRAVASRLFRQRDGEWKVLTDGGNLQFFYVKEGEDIPARAVKELKDNPGFWLPKGSEVPADFTPEVTGLPFTYGEEPEPTGLIPEPMETAYRDYRAALRTTDLTALQRLAWFPRETSKEEAEELFRDEGEWILASTPDLSETECIVFRELPGMLAVYAYVRDHPQAPGHKEVSARLFRKMAAGVRVQAEGGGTLMFKPEAGEDVIQRARQEMATDPGFWVPSGCDLPDECLDEGWTAPEVEEPVEPAPTPPAHWDRVMGPFDQELCGTLHCFAYDCELAITINGARLRYEGGNSHNQNLYGYKWGETPEESNVLTVGKNRIEIATRWTAEPQQAVTVQIQLFNDRDDPLCFRLQSKRTPEATYEAEFEIPKSPTKEIGEGEVELVDIRDHE